MPQKRILFYGASPTVPASLTTTAERFQASGTNFGNLMIGWSVLHIADYAPSSRGLRPGVDDPGQLHLEYDLIVISASNFLNSYSDFTTLADFLERVKLPIVVLGLGSQAGLEERGPIPMKPGTERFIRVLADKSEILGVRGAFTFDQLARLGIQHALPIGCPSFYLRPQTVMTLGSPHPSPSADFRFVFNSDPTIYGREAARPVLWAFHQWCVRQGGSFVAQNETFLWDGEGGSPDQVAAARKTALRFFGLSDAAENDTFLREKCRAYWDIPGWLEAMRAVDLVAGPRFHGGMLAVQSGRPALFTPHDMRTAELLECLHLPTMPMEAIPTFTHPAALRAAVDYGPTLRHYPEALQRFIDFLSVNGLGAKPAWRTEAAAVTTHARS